MPTLLLSPRYSQDSNDLLRAVLRTEGWDSHRAIRYQPPETTDDCCVYGEVLFCDIMAERMNLGLLEPPSDWLVRMGHTFGPDVLKRTMWACRADQLKDLTVRSFVKPANDKVFQYGVYERGTDVPLRYVDPACPCLSSEVVNFLVEMRFYLLDRKILAFDNYRLVGMDEEEATTGAINFITPLLMSPHDLRLPSAVVVDVGYIEDRGWALVEANQIYASGLYGNVQENADRVLPALLRASGPRSKVSAADQKYLRNP